MPEKKVLVERSSSLFDGILDFKMTTGLVSLLNDISKTLVDQKLNSFSAKSFGEDVCQLILRIDKINDEFPLPEQLPTANEDKFSLLIQSDATAEEFCTAAEVIEFGDSYEVPKESAATGSASDGKKGRTVAITTEDMQKRRNDVKARTTLLLALPDEYQLRFSKYKTAQELWAAILKTFGKETLEQTFNRLQAIVIQLEFMDVEIEQDDLNQKLLTSLAPEWLMHTIVWRNRIDLDTMSLDDLC
nr:hypothetical protein [Tanacetum cinerariifolium]